MRRARKSGGAIIASDTFTRADSPTNMGTTETGSLAWSAASGTWGISSNKAYNAGSGGIVTIPAGVADCSVTTTLSGTLFNAGMVGRYSDTNHYYLLQAQSVYQLYKNNAGFSLLASGGTPAGNDVLTLAMSGTSLVAKQNGATLLSVTDSALSGTAVGLRAGDTSISNRWDNLTVTVP